MDSERAWRTATRISLWAVAALFAVLLVTGVALTFRYRPMVTDAGVQGLEHQSRFTARGLHRAVSQLFVLAVFVLAFSAIGLFLTRRTRTPVVWPVVAAGLSVVAAFTGYLLPWDQLALWAVTVGTNMQGYRPILRGHDVRFVLLGSKEVSTATLSRWYWVHSVVAPLLLAGVVLVVVLRVRRPTRV